MPVPSRQRSRTLEQTVMVGHGDGHRASMQALYCTASSCWQHWALGSPKMRQDRELQGPGHRGRRGEGQEHPTWAGPWQSFFVMQKGTAPGDAHWAQLGSKRHGLKTKTLHGLTWEGRNDARHCCFACQPQALELVECGTNLRMPKKAIRALRLLLCNSKS